MADWGGIVGGAIAGAVGGAASAGLAYNIEEQKQQWLQQRDVLLSQLKVSENKQDIQNKIDAIGPTTRAQTSAEAERQNDPVYQKTVADQQVQAAQGKALDAAGTGTLQKNAAEAAKYGAEATEVSADAKAKRDYEAAHGGYLGSEAKKADAQTDEIRAKIDAIKKGDGPADLIHFQDEDHHTVIIDKKSAGKTWAEWLPGTPAHDGMPATPGKMQWRTLGEDGQPKNIFPMHGKNDTPTLMPDAKEKPMPGTPASRTSSGRIRVDPSLIGNRGTNPDPTTAGVGMSPENEETRGKVFRVEHANLSPAAKKASGLVDSQLSPSPIPAGYKVVGIAPDGKTVLEGPDGKKYVQ